MSQSLSSPSTTSSVRPTSAKRFSAMGTSAHVVVVGSNSDVMLRRAIGRVKELEALWSRFIPTSDVCRLNRANGAETSVGVDTIELVSHGVAGWRLTGGLFNPTMAVQLELLGYDRPFPELIHHQAPLTDPGRAPAFGCVDMVIDPERSTIRMPVGVGFDPGGLGKGLAADIVSTQIMNDGADGALVNLGGDLAVRGVAPEADDWVVTIREPSVCDGELATTRLRDAGLATSTTAKRRWSSPGGDRHHILDPNTGLPATSTAVLASVIAGSAWWAEVTATAIIVDPQLLKTEEASLRVLSNGRVERHDTFERFEQ